MAGVLNGCLCWGGEADICPVHRPRPADPDDADDLRSIGCDEISSLSRSDGVTLTGEVRGDDQRW